jgi:hypothetical protein
MVNYDIVIDFLVAKDKIIPSSDWIVKNKSSPTFKE